LSGGEQQRVAIARALVRSPRVILADEPTGNLDERTRDEIIALLEELWREHAQTIVMVTHDTQMAARASRRLWLDAGVVGAPGGVQAGYNLPREDAARFVPSGCRPPVPTM
jgi:putative ABC transport system ATP-binding protein